VLPFFTVLMGSSAEIKGRRGWCIETALAKTSQASCLTQPSPKLTLDGGRQSCSFLSCLRVSTACLNRAMRVSSQSWWPRKVGELALKPRMIGVTSSSAL